MKEKWKIIGRHKWVSGATITESASVNSQKGLRRYTATIRGWRNWKILEEETAFHNMKERTDRIIAKVTSIRDRIDSGDQTVFQEK